MAFEIYSCLRIIWAVSKRHVEVGNIVKEVNLRLVEQKTCANRVDGGIAPALVEKAAVLVKRVEKVNVGVAPHPVQATNLKVGPLTSLASALLLPVNHSYQ